MISVVIPTLNAANRLPDCLAALEEARSQNIIDEIVVADGGSGDETVQVAKAQGCVTLAVPKGRGSQLAAGVARATGHWVLILHADTVLGRGWADEVRAFMEGDGARHQAGVFRFALDDQHLAARWLERLVDWRMTLFALPYGDQGLLIHRTLYDAVGGFADIPLMEDVDLIRRIKAKIRRRGIVHFKTTAMTSAARYIKGGYV